MPNLTGDGAPELGAVGGRLQLCAAQPRPAAVVETFGSAFTAGLSSVPELFLFACLPAEGSANSSVT